MKNTTVIHHSADYDGIMCREVARHFLPEAKLIGWDFADKPLSIPSEGEVIVMDLPVDRVFGFDFAKPETVLVLFGTVEAVKEFDARLVWIDHHKSSIDTHPVEIEGYRIDGVAACRLAWQWFKNNMGEDLPDETAFRSRSVMEPYLIRLCGEYDIWDHRDPNAIVLQSGLRQLDEDEFRNLIEQEFQYPQVSFEDPDTVTIPMGDCLEIGKRALKAKKAADASIVGKFSHDVTWNGLKFLCLNSASFNSQTFESAVRPEHDALMGWRFDGKSGKCTVSLYHAPGKTDIDLSKFAVAMKGGGHRGAAGFQVTLAELATIIGAQ